MSKTAVFVGTRNVYEEMIPPVKALLINSDVDEIYLLIEDDRFPHELPACVKTINVSDQTFFPSDGPNYSRKWTYMTLMRAALAKVLPDIDVVLSLDNDVIALQDISDIWDIPLGDCYFAAAEEPMKSKGGELYQCDYYGNLGVALYNLRAFREDGMVDRAIKAINMQYWPFVEQDALNQLCQGRICPMPGYYNVNTWTKRDGVPRVIHYAAIKGWANKPLVDQYRQIPWDEVMRLHEEKR